MPTVVTMACPQCKAQGEIRIEGLYSGLGPARYACRVCAAPFESGRREWPELSTGGRVRYAAISLLYVVFGALGGGAVGFFVGHAWRDPYFSKQPAGFGDAIVPAIVGGVLIAIIQVARIPRSSARYAARQGAEPAPYRVPAILAGGGHTVFAFALLLLGGLGWLAAVIARELR